MGRLENGTSDEIHAATWLLRSYGRNVRKPGSSYQSVGLVISAWLNTRDASGCVWDESGHILTRTLPDVRVTLASTGWPRPRDFRKSTRQSLLIRRTHVPPKTAREENID